MASIHRILNPIPPIDLASAIEVLRLGIGVRLHHHKETHKENPEQRPL